MDKKILATLTLTTETFQIEPLQRYVSSIARHYQIPSTKILSLEILVEEIFVHVVKYAFANRTNETITVTLSVTTMGFMLEFHYYGLPFGYTLDRGKDEEDLISIQLIQSLSSDYRLIENGKNGQTIQIQVYFPTECLATLKRSTYEEYEKVPMETDRVELRELQADEIQTLVQCLYQVYGYSYSSNYIYYPEAILQRLNEGIYKGLVGINTQGEVIAHVAMLLPKAGSRICESGQAFVNPAYRGRDLFRKLKLYLIDEAANSGLFGVFSDAVTGHGISQKVNVEIGCKEIGLVLGYIPERFVFKHIVRSCEDQRQPVMMFFYATEHATPMNVYIPMQHRKIAGRIYQEARLERSFMPVYEVPCHEESLCELELNSDWDQAYIKVLRYGIDAVKRIRSLIRQAVAIGSQVVYFHMKLTDPLAPFAITEIENEIGFFFSCIVPYYEEGCDIIKMQYLIDRHITEEYVCTESDFGNEIKSYVFEKMREQSDK